MKNRAITAILSMTLLSGVHAAVIWEPIAQSATSAQSVTVDADKSSFRQRDKYRQGWFRINYLPSTKTDDGKDFSSSVQLRMADCKQGELALLQVTAFREVDLKGDIVEKIVIDRSYAISQLLETGPGSINRAVLDTLCARQQK